MTDSIRGQRQAFGTPRGLASVATQNRRRFVERTLALPLLLLVTATELAAEPLPDIVETIQDDEPSAAMVEPSAQDAEGDLVEVIADEDASSKGGPVAPAPARAAPDAAGLDEPAERFRLTGWARQSAELGLLDDREVLEGSAPEVVPYDRLILRSQLFTSARYARARWFEVNVSGYLSYGVFERAPARPDDAFTGFNGASTRASLESELYELSIGFFTANLDLRIGQQRVAWGRGEFLSPNDVVNARDRRDPFLSETVLRTVPTPLVRGDLDLGFAVVQVVLSPVFVPDRFDVYGSNWAGVQPDAPAGVRGFLALLQRDVDPSLHDSFQRLLQQTSLPATDLSEPSAGVRIAWTAGALDFNYYYHYGFDGPYLVATPAFVAGLAATDFSQAGLADFGPVYQALDAGQAPFQATYVRRHHVGFDAATTWGPFAFRLDAAYQSQRAFFQQDLRGALSPVLQAVGAIEYQTGDTDKLVLVEGLYQRILDERHGPLLIFERDSAALSGLLRWKLVEPFHVELRAISGIRPRFLLLQPELVAKYDALALSIGGLWLDGEAFSLGGYFRRNTELYAKVKYSF